MLQARLISTVSGNACRILETHFVLRYFATFQTDLNRWQRRCDRLTQLQRRIRLPPLEVIAVDGEDIKLPLPAVEPLRSPSQEELEYLVGFFDGDGCVTINKQTGGMQLNVSQNVDAAIVLLRFRSLLGGSVGRQAVSTGSSKAQLQWQIYGSKMIAAAQTLSRIPSMKQAQLRIAEKGSVPENARARVAQALLTLKQPQHVPDQWSACSWPYFAGFFDAEGCVIVHPLYVGLCLRLDQVNPCVLVRLLWLLHVHKLKTWSLYHRALLRAFLQKH